MLAWCRAAWVLCLVYVLSALNTRGFPLEYRKNLEPPITEISSDVECFADYMELWIPKGHVEGLMQWLSRTMRIVVSLVSLERLNLALSGSGYSLYMDPDGNYLFRAQYSASFVQLENGNYILTIRIFKKYLAEAARSDHYIMKCPVVMSPLGREHVCCRPNAVQVSRPMPQGRASEEVHWFLSLRGQLVVSVDDASLIGLNVELNSSSITVTGARQPLLLEEEIVPEGLHTAQSITYILGDTRLCHSLGKYHNADSKRDESEQKSELSGSRERFSLLRDRFYHCGALFLPDNRQRALVGKVTKATVTTDEETR
ncbi:hypothetical protein NDU88_011528 [Pleurodeles waltl]|uniref:Uncharacterized protein n=1 Tax=Pleurodeles waltl TaxID=8319 RepID=A0AAV7R087_PLEWA|nr:hypothetical protein NDU88_011528 [Pleurodeles waltl]